MAYIGKSPAGLGVRARYFYTATGGETSLSGADDNGRTLQFTDGEYVDVYLNGVLLVAGTDYGTGTANTISGLDALSVGNIVEIVAYDIFSLNKPNTEALRKRYYKTATGGETSISGSDDDGQTITFGANAEIEVYLNGVALIQGDDYNTSTANIVSGLAALDADDIVTIVAYEEFVLGDVVSKKSGGTFGNSISVSGDLTANSATLSGALSAGSATVSGNVLVGKTSTSFSSNGVALGTAVDVNGWAAWATGTPSAPGGVIAVNRLSSDGSIITFYKDGSNVGSIGVVAADNFYFAGNSGHAGFALGTVGLYPVSSTGANKDNQLDVGDPAARWDDIHATNGTIQTSDQNEKQQIASLTDAEITAAKAISKLFKTFKWNDKVEAKGDAARTHTGVIAQDVQQAIADAGLDAGDYAFFISATWWETQTEVPAVEADEENGIEAADAYTRTDTYDTAEEAPEGATERTRLGIRYPELLAFVGAATEQRLANIETRLTALEAE